MTITDYKILHEGDIGSLEKEVGNLIRAGWQPLGGLVAVPTSEKDGYYPISFFQTMIWYEAKE